VTRNITRPASIRTRLLQALLMSALLWCLALGVAMWLAMREEVDELLDDTLQSAAEGLVGLLAQAGTLPLLPVADSAAAAASAPVSAAVNGNRRFVWQLVGHQAGARVLRQSTGAPPAPLHATPSAGLSNVDQWRVFGQPMGQGAQMLYVAQTRGERGEAEAEIGFAVLLAGLPMVLLALLWLSARVRHELKPLQELSDRLSSYDPLQPGATLGVSDHEELRPVQAAIDALAARLARRIARERAFTAHAAHALRTPLAGIDAQLAVALREAPPELQPRLQRVRAAAGRLQRVVAALLALFRSGVEAQRLPLDPAALAARLPVEGLALQARGGQPVAGDVDLVSAALLNLLDNALRHGATQAVLSTPGAGQLQLRDDGPGITPERRRDLQDALDHEDYEGRMGLGLMLADLVARAHGGRLHLPPVDAGFAAVLELGPP
jgi:signal transduction histidine kinase